MQLYLPIAEISLNIFMLIGLGGAVGFLSGLFGVGGGFLLTPMLIFSGIPAPVAVASVTGQVVAASTSGALSYWRRGGIDVKLASFLIISGIFGAFGGVWTFGVLRAAGQLDLVISLGYLIFLGSIGSLMLFEAVGSMIKHKAGKTIPHKLPGQHSWVHGLPFRVRFKRSNLYVSILPVVLIGGSIGFLGSLLGIGGGFILVPALIYILRVPGSVVIGTSLLQVLAIMAATTILHAVNSQTVDILLAFSLMVGSVIGAQFGASAGQHLRGEQLRALLAIIVLAVAIRFALSLLLTPADPFSMTILPGGVT
ncbi:sulfite exporter TauE/SafE family protein [Maritalea porphyrae]|uniref:sulfite exporter TauE/SafE family protein n=1 Tax=Maritalea porphyrae TaxID=880732 RepID=UPI0022AEC255|nr:sulfite exporter TauE/SafE family protein [Maritalea porphyrae]MCZ4271588.1 sulfite exporter TauE/SafE family protein [Maritalea porphyrae]